MTYLLKLPKEEVSVQLEASMIRTLPFWSRQPLIKDMSFPDGLELPFQELQYW